MCEEPVRPRAVVFAGTTEGYEIARFLSGAGIPVLACTATEYGGRSLSENGYLRVRSGRMDAGEMEELLRDLEPELVIDGTHPYAAVATGNLRTACDRTGTAYMRILRSGVRQDPVQEAVHYAADTAEAVSYLEKTEGNILLTTGSKDLPAYAKLTGFHERVYARVLSLPSVIRTCQALGLEGRHLIAMQGPFSAEMNRAMLRQYDCRYLVTKDTGPEGGFPEKMEAAAACGVQAVVIGRPVGEAGLTLPEARTDLIRRFGLTVPPLITVLGIGMGSRETFTEAGVRAAAQADLVIGAKRAADAAANPSCDIFYEYRPSQIVEYIRDHPGYQRVVIALSGDVGFYSGAKRLLQILKDITPKVEVVCGISSVSYFMARIGQSWDDARLVSAHGRPCALAMLAARNKKVFAILGTESGAAELAGSLTQMDRGDILMYVGENLSYPGEKITCAPARELTQLRCDPLSVVCTLNESAQPLTATHGLADTAFVRGGVPMTKSEIRAVSLAKLSLFKDSICYDVGAGTGSVAVEMALRCEEGAVFAIEKKADALSLIRENRRRFALDHLKVIEGQAPEVLADLPAPTHAFIGGSSGSLEAIIRVLREKNPGVRIVVNCITLETVSEVLRLIRSGEFRSHEIVSVCTARSKEAGPWHMMTGENPVYICTLQN